MRPSHILMVEDNPADVELLRERLQHVSSDPLTISVAVDGQDALDHLHGRGRHVGAAAPDLVLLDLNLPKRSGCEVLASVKADRRLRGIPIVVLSSSGEEADVLRCYDLLASAYVRKPMDLAGYDRVVAAIHGFWLRVVRYPTPPE